MRFVFTAPRFHTNQRHAFKALLDAGHEVTLLALRSESIEVYDVLVPRILGCSRVFDILRRVGSALPGLTWSDVGGMPPLLRFWREIRSLRPHAVVVRNPSSAYGMLAMLVAKASGARLILYNQTPQRRELRRRRHFFQALFLLVSRAAWFTPVLGNPARFPSRRHLPLYVPFVMEPQISADDRCWFANGFVNLLHVGRFQPRKNHILFLKVVARLSRLYPIRASIVGQCFTAAHRAELEAVTRARARLSLENVVDIEINVPHLDMKDYYRRHDLFVLASRDEPAAVSPLEAMSYALPIVCSDTNGTSCYVRPGENGFVFHSGDADSMEVCLVRVIKDRCRLVEMARRSYELVLTEHAPSRYVDALVEMAGGLK